MANFYMNYGTLGGPGFALHLSVPDVLPSGTVPGGESGEYMHVQRCQCHG